MTDIRYQVAGPTLERFFASDDFVRCLVGPFGSGKTSACCVDAFQRCTQQAPDQHGVRRSRGVVIRNTFRQLSSTTIPSWRSWFGNSFGEFSWSEPYTHRLRFNLPDGTRVEADVVFLALDGPDAEEKLRGLEVTWAWLNECREIPKAVLNFLLGRVGRYPAQRDGGPSWSGIFADTNPWDVDHWLHRLLEEERPEGWRVFKQPGGLMLAGDRWVPDPAAENLANLPGGYGYYLRQVPGQRFDWVKVNLAGEYGLALDGKPVFPEYRDSVHCAPEPFAPIPGAPLIIGLDFGLTPAAAIGQQSVRGQWRFCDELVADDMGLSAFGEQLAARLAQWYPDHGQVTLWGDPAGQARDADERTAFQILGAKLNRVVRPASSNNLAPRLEAVRAPLNRMVDGEPGFYLSPACKVLRKGLAGGYHLKRIRVAEERYGDKPDKNEFSHVVDGLQYALLGGGEARRLVERSPADSRPIVADHAFSVMGAMPP